MRVLFKNRNSIRTRRFAYEIYHLAKICVKCYSTTNRICVHHKDENPWNEMENNLQILCQSCHLSHHKNTLWKTWFLNDNTKEKMSISKKWHKHWMNWKKHSEETKKKMSEAQKWKIIPKTQRYILRQARLWKPSNRRNKWKLINWLWLYEWQQLTWKSKRQFYKIAE